MTGYSLRQKKTRDQSAADERTERVGEEAREVEVSVLVVLVEKRL